MSFFEIKSVGYCQSVCLLEIKKIILVYTANVNCCQQAMAFLDLTHIYMMSTHDRQIIQQ